VPLAAANRRLEDLDGERAEVKVDVDRSSLAALRDLGSGFGELAGGLRDMRTVVSAARIPFLIASLGAVPAIASSAAVAVGQLAIGLSQGLAGGATVAGTALAGVVTGLAAYKAAISGLISQGRKAFFTLHENAQEALEMRNALILNTRENERFNTTLNLTSTRLAKVGAEVGTKVLPYFTRWLDLFRQRLPEIQPIFTRMVVGVTKVGDSFLRALNTGGRFKSFTNVLNFVATSAIRGARAAKNLGLGLLAAIQPVLRPAGNLQKTIVRLTRDFRRWAESARGQNQIATFIENAWNRAKQLYRIVVNLGRGFRNLFSIIAPGTSDMMDSLGRLSGSFARVGAKGTESRRRIQEFVNNSKPILKALGNLVGTVTTEFFKLAGGVAKMRNGKRDVSTLADAINGLARAIPPVRRLLQQTFKDLGPTIGPLAKQIGRFFKEFAGSTDVLTRTVRLMTGLLRQFNKLPEPVKGAIAELVAFRIIAKALGFGILLKLVGSLGKAGVALVRFGRGAKGVQAANAVMRGSFLRLATTIITRFGPGGAVYVFGKLAKHILVNSQAAEDAIEGFANRLRNTGAFGLIKFFQNLPKALRDAILINLEKTPIFGPILSQAARDGLDVAKQWSKDGQKAGTNAREGFKKGITSGPTGAKEFAEKTKAETRAHFGIRSPSTVFAAIGRNLVAGLIAGVRNSMPNVAKVMQALAKAIPDSVKKLLGISSPSKVMEKVGRDAGEGFARGLEGSKGRVASAAQAMADGMVNLGEVSRKKWEQLMAQGWQGRAGDSAERLYAPRGMSTVDLARRVGLPPTDGSLSWLREHRKGGISKEEMRQVMREHRSASSAGGNSGLAQEIARAVITVLQSGAYAAHLDRSVGGYIHHRTAMGADTR
jgi:hypothetical protein